MSKPPATVALDGYDVADIAYLLEATEQWLRSGHTDGASFSSFFHNGPPAHELAEWIGSFAAYLGRRLAGAPQ